MKIHSGKKCSRFVQGMLFLCFAGVMVFAKAEPKQDNAATLRAQYASMKGNLDRNQFGRPLIVDSRETTGQLQGNAYAVVDYPFSTVRTALNNADHWCDVLLLHLNTKYCRASAEEGGTILNVNVGKKTPEELADSTRIAFNYQVAAITPDYLKVKLDAKEGPMGTSNYRIAFDAVPLSKTRTFIHLSYSYSTSMTGRMAMRTYLSTAGSGKVGFTVVGKQPDGKPEYIDDVRGVIERNTMRYYLAIDAFLSALSAAPDAQFEKRIQTWFTSTERYARQLHEMERNEYLEMKRAENVRQLSLQ
jgi:hypothetical protein